MPVALDLAGVHAPSQYICGLQLLVYTQQMFSDFPLCPISGRRTGVEAMVMVLQASLHPDKGQT